MALPTLPKVPSGETLSELEAKYRRLAIVKSPDIRNDGEPEWFVLLRPPNRAEYKQLKAMLNNDTQRTVAVEGLMRKLAVYPDPAAVDAMIDEWPGIPEGCWPTIERLAGAAGSEERK